jgi:hypothetical protein
MTQGTQHRPLVVDDQYSIHDARSASSTHGLVSIV